MHHSAPRDEDLLMLAFDEEQSLPTVVEHVAQCETCRARLTRYRQLYHRLLRKLYRRECPSGMLISYYCAGLLASAERHYIAAHLEQCPLCAEEASLAWRWLATPLLPPPLMAPLERLHALLVSLQGRPTLWLRQYQAGELTLSLHLGLSPQGEHILLGILTSADPTVNVATFEGSAVALVPTRNGPSLPSSAQAPADLPSDTPTDLSATLDDRGHMVFKAVPLGTYTLILHLPGREVVIPDLAMEAAAIAGNASHTR